MEKKYRPVNSAGTCLFLPNSAYPCDITLAKGDLIIINTEPSKP